MRTWLNEKYTNSFQKTYTVKKVNCRWKHVLYRMFHKHMLRWPISNRFASWNPIIHFQLSSCARHKPWSLLKEKNFGRNEKYNLPFQMWTSHLCHFLSRSKTVISPPVKKEKCYFWLDVNFPQFKKPRFGIFFAVK